MRADHKNKLLKRNGNTSDIASAVMNVYNSDYRQVAELAETLKGSTDRDTCENIFNYVIDNVTYKEDPAGVQWVRTPARLLADGVGDCKSMAVFSASCLRCLGIDHVLRFVSFGSRKEATHVYVVAMPGTDNETIIDPVVRVNGLPLFDRQEQYTFKSDMRGTDIYRMSGIPNLDESTNGYKVWIGDENESQVTPGKHFLYALLDLNIEMLNISTKEKVQLQYLDNLDVISTLIHAYNVVGGNTESFKEIAFVVCCLVYEGRFKSKELNFDARYANLDDLYTIVETHYNNGYTSTGYDADLWRVINTEVLPHNEIVAIGAISGSETDFVTKMKESGIYYIYMFVTESDLKAMPAIVATKLRKQQETFNWVAKVNTYQTESALQLTIRSGIVRRTGMTPEQIIAKLKAGESDIPNIGEPITLTIITVISIITGLVKLIQLIWPPKTTPKPENIEAGSFDPTTDFAGSKNTTTASLTTIGLPLAVGGGILYWLFKSK